MSVNNEAVVKALFKVKDAELLSPRLSQWRLKPKM